MDLVWKILRPRALAPRGVLVAASARGVVEVCFVAGGAGGSREPSRPSGKDGPRSRALAMLDRAVRELRAYFRGELTAFRVPVDLEGRGTSFQRRVWSALRGIPHGELTTYGRLASKLGLAGGARAVGGAVGRNPIPVILPCHRVVGEDGSLVGFASGLAVKVRLLELEGKTVAAGTDPARRRIVSRDPGRCRDVS